MARLNDTGAISEDEIVAILYRALKARVGLVLWTNDFLRAKQRIYKARVDRGDEDLMSLQVRDGSQFGEGCFTITRGAKKNSRNGEKT